MSKRRLVHLIPPTIALALLATTASPAQGQQPQRGRPVTAEQLGLEIVMSSTVLINPGEISQRAEVQCPSGKVAISGGFSGGVASGAGVFAALNAPNNIQNGRFARGWVVVGVNTAAIERGIVAYALCINES